MNVKFSIRDEEDDDDDDDEEDDGDDDEEEIFPPPAANDSSPPPAPWRGGCRGRGVSRRMVSRSGKQKLGMSLKAEVMADTSSG
jgi:hypothetical protein